MSDVKMNPVDGILDEVVEHLERTEGVQRAPVEEAPPRAVNGVLDQVEAAEAASVGLRCNHSVVFLGVVCPIVCDEGDFVQIQHGNNVLRVAKDQVLKTVGSAERREPNRKWDALYRNPLLKPHRP